MEDFKANDIYEAMNYFECKMEESGSEFDMVVGEREDFSSLTRADAERFYEWLGKALGKT